MGGNQNALKSTRGKREKGKTHGKGTNKMRDTSSWEYWDQRSKQDTNVVCVGRSSGMEKKAPDDQSSWKRQKMIICNTCKQMLYYSVHCYYTLDK